jgi:hypothetical protein
MDLGQRKMASLVIKCDQTAHSVCAAAAESPGAVKIRKGLAFADPAALLSQLAIHEPR